MVSQQNQPKYITVIGASAGGFHSVIEVLAQLTASMDTAVLVVMHLNYVKEQSGLLQRLQNSSDFECKLAEDGETIQNKLVYLAVPDKHLLIKENKIILGEGTAENRWRPSIDVLFRSAAAAYNSRVIGIVLSGLMQDGTAGMIAIKRCGGTCIVQHPEEAEYPDMPLAVLNNMDVDYCVFLEQVGTILREKMSNGIPKPFEVPADVKAEAEIAARVAITMETLKELGEKSLFSCPDCGGGLWQMKNEQMIRYRCHIGHVYTQDELLIKQTKQFENTLWIALRMFEERRQLLNKMANEENSKGWLKSASQKNERSRQLEVHIERLKEILFETNEP
jgi:two-component system chemotaxis response regulator CheB